MFLPTQKQMTAIDDVITSSRFLLGLYRTRLARNRKNTVFTGPSLENDSKWRNGSYHLHRLLLVFLFSQRFVSSFVSMAVTMLPSLFPVNRTFSPPDLVVILKPSRKARLDWPCRTSIFTVSEIQMTIMTMTPTRSLPSIMMPTFKAESRCSSRKRRTASLLLASWLSLPFLPLRSLRPLRPLRPPFLI